MNLLGSIGQLYMFVLLVLLFLGSGFALWRFINFLMERNIIKSGPGDKSEPTNGQLKSQNKVNLEGKVKGGLFMGNNGWVKLAVFSFVGIIVSVAILGLVSTNNMQGTNMNGQIGNIHQQHQQQGMQQNGMGNMNMQGGMNVNTPMGNMQMQGNMNGNMNMPMNGGMTQNQYMMQQQLNQMQMQLNQMQQQMGMMNGNMGGNTQMQQGGMNNMGGMGMMNGMMGGMMNMGNMNNMQQNNSNMNNMQQNNSNMNNMQQNNGNSGNSGGGMSMM